MTIPLTLRPAAPGDWPAIWRLWHEIVAAGETYAYDPGTGFTEGRELWFPPPPAETWLADRPDGVVAGTYLLTPNKPGLGAHIANAGFMVAGTARGLGVGRRLAEHCLDRARELGYRGMQFNAVVATNVGAVHLWQSLGFDIVGTVPGAFRHRTEGYVDLHIMFREL